MDRVKGHIKAALRHVFVSLNLYFDLCLQVDLGFLRFVTAIGTQGAISKETKKHYFVRSYKVDLSSNGEDWVTVKDGAKQKVLLVELGQSTREHFQSADYCTCDVQERS